VVIAATVAHAEHIATRLAALGERSVVVSCRTPDAHQMINNFRVSKDRWIISVGMISEGTDIPRLQVCCHLSRIRTELHFRQVLGRILRRQAGEPSEIGGWLYVLAEPTLTEFARRIGEDLPEQNVVSFSPKASKQNLGSSEKSRILINGDESSAWDLSFGTEYTLVDEGELTESRNSAEFTMSNHYWSEILSLFEHKVV
jgi:superfamily II DNA or RNA helicase